MGHIDFVKLLSQLASLTRPQRAQVRSALDERASTSNNAIASARRPKAVVLIKTQRLSGAIVSCRLRPRTAPRTRAGLSRPMRPYFWSPSRGNASCHGQHANAAEWAPSGSTLRCWWCATAAGKPPTSGWRKLTHPHITAVLRPLVDKDAILRTDGARVYQTVAREMGLTHRAINAQQGIRVIDGAFHIQNVNAYDSRLKQWMGRFHGVATKYLENYLGWRRMLERYRQSISPTACLCEALGRVQLQQLIQT
jgi:hypothetical protein